MDHGSSKPGAVLSGNTWKGIGILVCLLLCILEMLAYEYKGIYAIVASRIWLSMFVVYGGLTIFHCAQRLVTDIRQRQWLLVAVVTFIGVILFWKLGNWVFAQPNYESVEEVAGGIHKYFQKDMGYADNAFLGYPARQYVLVALPSILWGKSLWALQIGFAVLLYSGFILFLYALRDTVFAQIKGRDYATVMSALLMFSFPVFVSWIFLYEQTTLAVAFELHAAAWLLLACQRLTAARAYGLLWAGCMLGTTYTSAYSVWALLLLYLASFMAKKYKEIPRADLGIYAGLWLAMLVFGLQALSIKPKEALAFNPSHFLEKLVVPFFENAVPSFITIPFMHPVTLGLFVLFFLTCFTGKLGERLFILGWWMLGVMVMAVILHGTSGNLDFLVQVRTLPVIPILAVAVIWALAYRFPKAWEKLLSHRGLKAFVTTVLLAVVCHSLYLGHMDSSPKLPQRAVEEIIRFGKQRKLTSRPVNTVSLLVRSRFNVDNYFDYFMPAWRDATLRYENKKDLTDKSILVLSESPQTGSLVAPPPGWQIERFDKPIEGVDGRSTLHIVFYKHPR